MNISEYLPMPDPKILERRPIFLSSNLSHKFQTASNHNCTVAPTHTFPNRSLILSHYTTMISRLQYFALFALTIQAYASAEEPAMKLRGANMQPPASVCPTDAPLSGSECQPPADGTPCFFNFVKTPGPSPEENNFVPSISCTCGSESQWECGVAPEYIKALTQSISG